MSVDHLIVCPGCSDYNGFEVYRHKSMFRPGRRNCAICETEEELNRYANLKADPQPWEPSHGPKPLLTDPRSGKPI